MSRRLRVARRCWSGCSTTPIRPSSAASSCPLTVARLATNAVYRFAPPFLATIARGLDVDLADLGVALAITELAGLASPLIGRLIDRVPRRRSMVGGLAGIAVGAAIAGLSTGIVMFTAGLLLLAVAKIVFDVGLISWTPTTSPYERRGRVVGIIETSWALGLLVGVTPLGLVAAATSWRWSYVVGAVAVVAAAGACCRRPPGPDESGRRRRRAPAGGAVTGRLRPSGWAAVVGMFGLMAAAQALFVTFGAWLEDDFGVRHRRPRRRDVRDRRPRAAGVDDVGGAHRPLGQGAQRRAGAPAS